MVGIGYRKDFAKQFLEDTDLKPGFIEVAPENWMGIGGYWKQEFKKVTEKYPLFCHGLSLSIGSPDPLNLEFLKEVKSFLNEYNVQLYSEHLSFSQVDNAHIYDLLPIPFTKDAVQHVAQKINQAQDFLERKLVLENVSYYTVLQQDIPEIDFINEIVSLTDCDLLLDVNNVFVNANNHNYDAQAYIDQVNFEHVKYIHMAGHRKVNESLIIDTHGSAIIDPVYELFHYTMQKMQNDVPVLLERDFNIPEMKELQTEINNLKRIKKAALNKQDYAIIG